MRDYGIVSPRFWIGETGKSLRGDMPAQVLAMYLMTSPHSTMTGVFHCPVLYMAHETGMDMEGASKALQRLIEGGFCEYEEASETVFVVRMAAYQIGEELSPGDNRVKGLNKEVSKMAEGPIKSRFLEVYGEVFHLEEKAKTASPSEAPSDPLRSQEQEQEQEQKKDNPPSKSKSAITLRTWLKNIREAGEQAIPENDPILVYAEDAGIPGEFIRLAWVEFKSRYLDSDKKYKDWRKAFSNAVRGNWFKLWWVQSGEYILTSGGQQAMTAMNNRDRREAAA